MAPAPKGGGLTSKKGTSTPSCGVSDERFGTDLGYPLRLGVIKVDVLPRSLPPCGLPCR
jgi:hypothetical protein